MRRTARQLWANKLALGALLMLLVIFAAAIGANLIAPYDPAEGNITDRLLPPGRHPEERQWRLLGTDQVGRDVLSRLIHGARVSLLVGVAGTAISLLVGTVLGLVSGFWGGPIDRALLRLTDIQLAFPFIALAVTVISVIGPGLLNVILVLAATGWVLYTRVVREEVMRAREHSYVEAARAMGGNDVHIVVRHILPNIVAPVIVISSFAIAQMIITEASLSFLGLGIRPPTPTWGGMLSDARNYMQVAWWLPTFPGAALLVTLLGINVVGDWLRDTLDPTVGEAG
ncbi:MAG: ABC transporter permease [Actinobacteria bacterium]|nr:ABC transporter permease [Actinomycetota bacterium]